MPTSVFAAETPKPDIETQALATSFPMATDPSGGRGEYVYDKSQYPFYCTSYTVNLGDYNALSAAAIAGLDLYIAKKTTKLGEAISSGCVVIFSGIAAKISYELEKTIFPGDSVSVTVKRYYNPIDASALRYYYKFVSSYYDSNGAHLGDVTYYIVENYT